MSRSVFQHGEDWPENVQAIQTFDSNFKYHDGKDQNGLDWQKFQHHCFQWLAFANEENPALDQGDSRSFQMTMPDENGVVKPVKITPQSPAYQTNINEEMSAIIWRQDWEELGLGDLVSVEQDEDAGWDYARIKAVRTPASVADKVRAVQEDFVILEINEAARTITFEGKKYYRKRKTTGLDNQGLPIYDIGEHVGFGRNLRDQLTNDIYRTMDSFKVHEYDYGFMTKDGVDYRYTGIVDSPETDQRTGAHPDGEDVYPFNPNATSAHTVYFETMPEGVFVGGSMTLLRRLPFCTSMLSTNGIFAQEYGYWDLRWRFSDHKRQFQSAFNFPGQRETGDREYPQHLKDAEGDIKEVPANTTPFYNTHRPIGGRDPAFSMLNYAELNDLEPVQDHPEWTAADKQQHQALIGIDDPNYVDSTKWHDTRVSYWHEGNPHGFPADSMTWHERTPDGKFKYICGCLCSPDFHTKGGILNALQIFITNAVDGGFVADMEYFAPDAASTNEEYPMYMDVAHIKCYQFAGLETGGSGFPDPDGKYPNGFQPYPNDITGNSGSGIASPLGKITNQTVVEGYNQIIYNGEPVFKTDGGRLLRPVSKLRS